MKLDFRWDDVSVAAWVCYLDEKMAAERVTSRVVLTVSELDLIEAAMSGRLTVSWMVEVTAPQLAYATALLMADCLVDSLDLNITDINNQILMQNRKKYTCHPCVN